MSYRRVVRIQKQEPDMLLTAAELENLERRTTAFLYAIWAARGVKKKIIVIESNGYYEDVENG